MSAMKKRFTHILPIFRAKVEPVQAPSIMLGDKEMAILKCTRSLLINTTVAKQLQIRLTKEELPLASINVEPMKKMNDTVMNGPTPPKNPP